MLEITIASWPLPCWFIENKPGENGARLTVRAALVTPFTAAVAGGHHVVSVEADVRFAVPADAGCIR